ncbi:hypothetical protein [Streptosporangium vulgare]|uniref:hypothetical protein n=1 Tax=Streptosporangium vulgare TaxID=46190 RepID=UPI0031CE2F57
MEEFKTTHGATNAPDLAIRSMIAGCVGSVHEKVDEAVDAGLDRGSCGVDGERVRDGEHAAAMSLSHSCSDSGCVKHRKARGTFDGTVIDHELDVIRTRRNQCRDVADGLFGCRGERHDDLAGPVLVVIVDDAAIVSGPTSRRKQLTGVPARRGDAEAGRSHVGNVVVVGYLAAIAPGQGALHFEFGGDSEP